MLLILGNGPSADRPEVARAMQSMTVMRINAGLHPGRFISSKCDIWGTSLEPLWPEPVPRPAQIWWSSHPFAALYCERHKGASFETITAAHVGRFDVQCPKELKLDLSAEFHPKEPSTGNVLIAMAVHLGLVELPVYIAGFSDGFDTKDVRGMHYYSQKDGVDQRLEQQLRLEAPRWHDFAKERAYRQRLVHLGLVHEI